jgi:outer membrane protein
VLNAQRSYVRGIQGGVPNSSSYAVVLGLQIPIFAGFSRRYDVRAVREQYEAALANLEATRLAVAVQVYTSYYALQAAAKSVTLSTALLRDAARSADVVAGQYREGVNTIIDLLVARSALATARAQAIQARWEWRIALVQLGHDVGVLDLSGNPQLLPGSPPPTPEAP